MSFTSFPLAPPSPPHMGTDTSVSLLVLSCHQGLLGAFESMCISSHFALQALHPPTSSPSLANPPAVPFISSSTAQIIVIANLISHFLTCLDGAIASMANLSQPLPLEKYTSNPMLPSDSPSSFSIASHSPGPFQFQFQDSPDVLGLGRRDTPDIQQQEHHRQSTDQLGFDVAFPGINDRHSCRSASKFILEQMDRRQIEIQAHVRKLKGLLQECNVI
ncbi:hypothetical protein QBC46DRAFT_391110 [Diplogelasinospora grovesii]|uniref:Uncharacterized protein n=1 Tax=Diplogelasinospora grovesii TaxID=303347 RepID=A0AAN6S1V7_9PEZI|nr:hypothetical protein QBC46DRAFT_391110 [Diplogelasinospora grovesii]